MQAKGVAFLILFEGSEAQTSQAPSVSVDLGWAVTAGDDMIRAGLLPPGLASTVCSSLARLTPLCTQQALTQSWGEVGPGEDT